MNWINLRNITILLINLTVSTFIMSISVRVTVINIPRYIVLLCYRIWGLLFYYYFGWIKYFEKKRWGSVSASPGSGWSSPNRQPIWTRRRKDFHDHPWRRIATWAAHLLITFKLQLVISLSIYSYHWWLYSITQNFFLQLRRHLAILRLFL